MHYDFEDLKSDMPFEAMLETTRNNCDTLSKLQREIDRLENSKVTKVVERPTTSLSVTKTPEEAPTPPVEYEDNIGKQASYYLDNLPSNLPNDIEEVKRILRSILPSRNNSEYHKIVSRMRLEYILKYNEYMNLLAEGKGDFNRKDVEQFLAEAKNVKNIADLLGTIGFEEVKEEEVNEHNTIIFMSKDTGNSYIEDDLDGIPEEFKEGFIELIDSIRDGSFIGVKRLVNNDNCKGICEVKSFAKRVLFDRVSANTYCIITGFIKKTTSNKGYRDFVTNRCTIYRMYEDKIKSLSNEPEFLKGEEEKLNRLYEKLGKTITPEEKGVVL